MNLAALDKLHSSMSMAEKEDAGHMSNRKMRSSFVDSSPSEHSYFAKQSSQNISPRMDGENMGRRSVSTRGSLTATSIKE